MVLHEDLQQHKNHNSDHIYMGQGLGYPYVKLT